MYKNVVFCPYFGTLPVNFPLWLKSCSYNVNTHFIVFTNDSTKYRCPSNVEIILYEFEELKIKIQSKFDFKISLNTPYKLCDYKPAYGYIFDEYIKDEKYWGYCDLDMIFGDVEKFLPESEYDKISYLGHFCLYKNVDKVKRAFMLSSNSKIDYIDILSNSFHFGFDEIGDYCINNLLLLHKMTIYNYEKNIADISCARSGMVLSHYDNGNFIPEFGKRLFAFEDGHIYAYEMVNKNIVKKEYAYIHFQKRKINVEICDSTKFIITPVSIINYKEVNNDLIHKYQNRKIYWFFKRCSFKIKALKKRIQRKKHINRIIEGKGVA